MAVEQDWAAYTDQALLADTDTLLARTAGGAGVEVPGSALVKKDASGNVGIGGAAAERLDVYGTVQARAQKAFNAAGFQPYMGLADSNAGFAEVRLINANGALYILNGGALRWKFDTAGHMLPETDNTNDIGSALRRIDTLFAGTSPVITSDEREKQWRGAMTATELRAANRILAEQGFYQWLHSIAAKGAANARLHFGPRAQRVWAIMAEEGLVDPIDANGQPGSTPYAFLCYNEWAGVPAQPAIEQVADEDGNVLVEAQPARPAIPAGDRFGVRVDQLALFLIATLAANQTALQARLAELEDRLAALEAAA